MCYNVRSNGSVEALRSGQCVIMCGVMALLKLLGMATVTMCGIMALLKLLGVAGVSQ